jgi:spoIIIJ-associated protein
MEWIEVTAGDVAAARDRALDLLGVHEDDIEIEVLAEGRTGFLGLGRTEARIRARVRPMSREKPQDRRRKRKGQGRRDQGEGTGSTTAAQQPRKRAEARVPKRDPKPRPERQERRVTEERSGARDEQREPAAVGGSSAADGVDDVSVDEQAQVARELLAGLSDLLALDAKVEAEVDDDGVIHAAMTGDQLGLLVGARGATLSALEEIVRAAVSHAAGGHGARLHLDVGNYRSLRREALAKFARSLAEDVKATGRAKALEPMPSADRKVVHDTVAEIDGVATSSAGEDPRRYVVISPATVGDD